MGKILDTYFKFGPGGDQYLGRELALLDPNDKSFAVLPPHWKNPNDPKVDEGVRILFGRVGEVHTAMSGILSLLLASVVYHSDWILDVTTKNRSHPFNSNPIIHKNELLMALRENVTLDPSQEVPIATGVPPNVLHSLEISRVLETCDRLKADLSHIEEKIHDSVFDAIDEKVKADGSVNSSIMEEALKKLKLEIIDGIEKKLTPNFSVTNLTPAMKSHYSNVVIDQNAFLYDGGLWCVPKGFAFPDNVRRRDGWRMWLCGTLFMNAENGEKMRIKPYRFFTGKQLPTKHLKNQYKICWCPIFRKMAEAPGIQLPTTMDASTITEDYVDKTYELATAYLKNTYEYLFEKEHSEQVISSWSITTWSNRIQRSKVMEWGTPRDKALFDPVCHRSSHRRKPKAGVELRRSSRLLKKSPPNV